MEAVFSQATRSPLQILHAYTAPPATGCSSTLRRRKSCFVRTCVETKTSLNGLTSDAKATCLEVYEVLKFELLNDPVFQWTHDSHQWMEQMMDYNVPRGKLFRALSAIDCYKSLTRHQPPIEDELFLANVLGWCIEWIQSVALICDDIMDNSETRRGQACWYRVPKVGNIALNDAFILQNQVPRILRKHFRQKPYYVDLMHLFDEVSYQTTLGQMMDLTTAAGEKDLSKYSLTLNNSPMHDKRYISLFFTYESQRVDVENFYQDIMDHHHIAKYKTSCYSFYLPVACAFLLAGENLDDHVNVKELLLDMGIYFQVMDDYLDCYGDPKKTGKIGTDIEDFKCSWLILKALELCSDDQKKILLENYGKKDEVCVAKVKGIYDEVDLQSVFASYQKHKCDELQNRLEAHPNKAVQAIWDKYAECFNKLL